MDFSIAPALALLGGTPHGGARTRRIIAWANDVELERLKESLNPAHNFHLWWDAEAMVHAGPTPANRICPGHCIECELRQYCGMDNVGRAGPYAAHNLDDYIYTRLVDVGRATFDERLLWWDASISPNIHYGPQVPVLGGAICKGCVFCDIKRRLLFLEWDIIS